MSAAPTFRFPLRIEAVAGNLGGPDAVEDFALDLRRELADLDVTRIDQVPGGPAPEGTRALELVAAFEFIITAVQAGEALAKVVQALRRCAARYAQRRRTVRLVIAGTEVDLVSASPGELEVLVQRLLALPAAARIGTRSALIVANARYDDPALAQLRAPGHDAEALVRVLGDPAIGGFETEALIDADERTIRRRIATFFAGRDRDDVLLLHFSCHGVKDTRGRLHLAARDTDLSVLGATSIPASFVNDLLAESQSRRVMLILDCCYSGAFARGVGVRGGDEVHIADEFGAGSGRIVLTASSATEYSFEDGELTRAQGQPSAFTGALVRGLETGEADLDADGEISIDELYDYTYRSVRDNTSGQAPMKWSFGVEGSLVVARSVRPAVVPAAILDDLASDRVVLRLEAVRALEQLLREGKAGQRASAYGALSGLRDGDDSVRVRNAAAQALAGTEAPPAAPAAAPEVVPPEPEPPKPVPVPEPTRPRQRLGVLLVIAAVLGTAAAVLYLVGSYVVGTDSFSGNWFTDLGILAYVIAVVLLFTTRDPRWGGVIVGLLAWEWLNPAILLHSEVRSALPLRSWVLLALADLAAIAAQLCASVAVLRAPRGRRRTTRLVRGLLAGAVAAVSVPLSVIAANVLAAASGIYTTEGTNLRIVLAVWCAVVPPLILFVASGNAAAPLVWWAWVLGGAFVTLDNAVLLHRNRSDYSMLGPWWQLFLLIGVAIAVAGATWLTRPDRYRVPASRS